MEIYTSDRRLQSIFPGFTRSSRLTTPEGRNRGIPPSHLREHQTTGRTLQETQCPCSNLLPPRVDLTHSGIHRLEEIKKIASLSPISTRQSHITCLYMYTANTPPICSSICRQSKMSCLPSQTGRRRERFEKSETETST